MKSSKIDGLAETLSKKKMAESGRLGASRLRRTGQDLNATCMSYEDDFEEQDEDDEEEDVDEDLEDDEDDEEEDA